MYSNCVVGRLVVGMFKSCDCDVICLQLSFQNHKVVYIFEDDIDEQNVLDHKLVFVTEIIFGDI